MGLRIVLATLLIGGCSFGFLAGCGAQLGAAHDLVPLTGQKRAVSTAPQQLAWHKTFIKGQLLTESSRETARAAYDPKSRLMWLGTAHSSFKCINSVSGQVVWEIDVPGGSRGEAIWHDGAVYFGGEGGQFLALDAATGEQKWSYKVQAAVRRAPVISGGLVIFVDGANTIIALEHRTGKWRWQYRRDPPKHFALAGEARPIVVDGRVYLGFSDGHLVALSSTDGTVAWSQRLSDPNATFQDADARAAFSEGVLYASSVSGDLFALDPVTGKVKWRQSVGGALQLSVFQGDLILAQPKGRLFRFDVYKRKTVWSIAVNDQWGSPTEIEQSGDNLVVGWSKGGLYWVDGRTGEPTLQFNPGSGISARPLVTQDGIYVLANQGTLFAFRTNLLRRTQQKTPLVTSPGRGL